MENSGLTPEQEQLIIDEWNSRVDNPPSLLELIRVAFPNTDLDGRSKEGRLVKAFLATRKIKARGAHQYKPKEKTELTPEQIEYIGNNGVSFDYKPLAIAKVLFDNDDLTPLHPETRAVKEHLDSLDLKVTNQPPIQNQDSEEYKPPNTFDRTLTKVNRYVHEGIDKNKITPTQKKDVSALMGYLHTYRFIHQINSYNNEANRELFESSFVRYSYNKHDLTQEEVDQYIVLSAEVVIAANIQARVERLQLLLDESADDTDGRRISMALVESINTAQTEYNQCVNRQQKLLESLKEKRSDKLKKQIQNNASILNLVTLWKEEESRQQMIQLAELRKKDLKEEVDNLSSMSDMKAKILGLTEGEVLD